MRASVVSIKIPFNDHIKLFKGNVSLMIGNTILWKIIGAYFLCSHTTSNKTFSQFTSLLLLLFPLRNKQTETEAFSLLSLYSYVVSVHLGMIQLPP